MTNEKELNINLTFIVELLEVINRFIDLTRDNKALRHILKNDFNRLMKEAHRLDRDYRSHIKKDSRFEDAEEMFDTDVDNLFELISATRGINTEEGYSEAITLVKSVAKRCNNE